MAEDSARSVVQRYVKSQHTAVAELAEDVVFTLMPTGEEHHGREGVRRLMRRLCEQAFEATLEPRTLVCEERHAVQEALLVGRHTGAFAGVPATNRAVRVPVCIVYDLADARIRRARVYLELPVLLQQIGAAVPAPLPLP